jgi:hypothetical protein
MSIPKDRGRSKSGSNFFTIARYAKKQESSIINICGTVTAVIATLSTRLPQISIDNQSHHKYH